MKKIERMVEFNTTMKNKLHTPYFLYFQYFATGEGMTDSCALVFEHSKKKAIEKFFREGILNHLTDETEIQEGIKYFTLGVTAYDVNVKKNIPKIEEVLTDYVSQPALESILEAIKCHAICEFKFHLYRNFS